MRSTDRPDGGLWFIELGSEEGTDRPDEIMSPTDRPGNTLYEIPSTHSWPPFPSQCGYVHPTAPHGRCLLDHQHSGAHRTTHGEWPNLDEPRQPVSTDRPDEALLELIDACIGSVACDGSTAGACANTLKAQVRALLAERDSLTDWRATVTVALQRPGGAFFDDVPNHIRALVAERDSLQAKTTQQALVAIQQLRNQLSPEARLTDLVPGNWLDPLLSGPSAVIGRPPYDCADIDRLLDAVRLRIGAVVYPAPDPPLTEERILQQESFCRWWEENRDGSPNAAYARVDRFVKAIREAESSSHG